MIKFHFITVLLDYFTSALHYYKTEITSLEDCYFFVLLLLYYQTDFYYNTYKTVTLLHDCYLLQDRYFILILGRLCLQLGLFQLCFVLYDYMHLLYTRHTHNSKRIDTDLLKTKYISRISSNISRIDTKSFSKNTRAFLSTSNVRITFDRLVANDSLHV